MKSQEIRAFYFSALLVGLVVLSSCSRHENRYRPDSNSFTTQVERISQELDLNQGQLEKLDALISMLDDKETTKQKGRAIVVDIAKQLEAEQFDEKYAANTISNYLDEVEELSLDLVTKLSVLHASLSAEQKVKLAKHLPAANR